MQIYIYYTKLSIKLIKHEKLQLSFYTKIVAATIDKFNSQRILTIIFNVNIFCCLIRTLKYYIIISYHV